MTHLIQIPILNQESVADRVKEELKGGRSEPSTMPRGVSTLTGWCVNAHSLKDSAESSSCAPLKSLDLSGANLVQ